MGRTIFQKKPIEFANQDQLIPLVTEGRWEKFTYIHISSRVPRSEASSTQGMAALASLAGFAASNGSIGQTGPQANSSWTAQRGLITWLKMFRAP